MRDVNPILQVVSNWFKRNFSDPEALGLFFTLLIGFILLEFFGKYLLPVVISIFITYLLMYPMRLLQRWRFPHWLAFGIVYIGFLAIFLLSLLGLFPLLWRQFVGVLHELPRAFMSGQAWITSLVEHYPKFFPDNSLGHAAAFLHAQSAKIGQFILSFSLATIPGLIQAVLYLVLMPLLVFFFLKDGARISAWVSRYLPRRRGLIQRVSKEVSEKIGIYIRGRVLEVIIVGVVSIITFSVLGLQYAFLLGALVGLSVIVPYIGAIVVTIPVLMIGLMQWGLSAHFSYLLIAHAIIIAADGNLLVPILFSETMDLHPIVIIVAVLVFGGIWGFWGVFFAIPLATFIKAVLTAWPQNNVIVPQATEAGVPYDEETIESASSASEK